MEQSPSFDVSDHGTLAHLGAGLQFNHFSYGVSESLATLALPTAPPDPLHPSSLFGRRKDIEKILGTLDSADTAGIWLDGPAGVGTSEVARQVARRLEHGGRTVWWLRASEDQTLLASLVSIAHQAGAKERDFRYMHPADVLWRSLNSLTQPWAIVLDDWQGGGLAHDWIRQPGAKGLIVVAGIGVPPPQLEWIYRAHLKPIGPLYAARLLRKLAPRGGTMKEARSLAEALSCNAMALVGAGRYLQRLSDVPNIGDDTPRTFASLETAYHVSASAHFGEAFPFLKVLDKSLSLLDAQGSVAARPIINLIAALPCEPLPASIFRVAGGLPKLTEVTQTDIAQGLRDLEALQLVGFVNSEREPLIEMNRLVHGAQRFSQRSSAQATEELDLALKLLEKWTDKNPSHMPAAWHSWQAISPHLQTVGDSGDVLLTVDQRKIVLDFRWRAAEFHYLAGQYEIAERICRSLLDTLDAQSESEADLWTSTSLLYARTLREQGDAPAAEACLMSLQALVQLNVMASSLSLRELDLSLARTRRELGKPREALKILESLVDFQATLPAPDASSRVTLNDWAILLNASRCFRELGDFDRAIAISDRLLLGWDAWCTRESLHFVDMQFEHAENLSASGEQTAATELRRSNLKVARKLLGKEHLNVLILEANQLAASGGRPAETNRRRRQLYARIAERFGEQHPLAVEVRAGLAD